jgi:hypothetical protein
MNKHDQANYFYIMSLSPEQFEKWYDSLSPDDVDYALELLQQARTEVDLQVAELYDSLEDTSDAVDILKRFTLKGE